MQSTNAKNNFHLFEPPLEDCKRQAVTLEISAQTFAIIDSWATAHRLTFAAVMDQAATEVAREIAGQPLGVARDLWIDRFRSRSDRLNDGSIRPAPATCGKPTPPGAKSIPLVQPAPTGSIPPPPPTQTTAEIARTREILGYYQALTGNRLKPADYTSMRQVYDLPDLVIQTGILHALNYATRPVGSFAYCVRAMENFLDPELDLERICNELTDKLIYKRSTGQIVLPLAGEKLLIGEFNRDGDSGNENHKNE